MCRKMHNVVKNVFYLAQDNNFGKITLSKLCKGVQHLVMAEVIA